ncbi:B3 domain-containing protein [Melia azedarach]|uniref:B3 domain-containing protein n=1 Tax=Melia azedarach TaxID=155640 RepID=A0ACC1XZV7_MELAZ|nr:B3 domain-containing protein [Melia azedarach]
MMKLCDDGGGSFHGILSEAEALAVEALLLLSEEFVTFAENRVAKFDNLGFHVARRRRDIVLKNLPRIPATVPQLPPLVLNMKKKIITLKRCFDQIQNSGEEEEEEEAIRKPKRQKKRKDNSGVQEHVPDMPESFKNRIEEENGTDVALVIQKHITASDLKKHLNRLSIPKDQIRADDFVNEEEKRILEGKNPIRVLLIPPSLKENVTLDLKRWTMNNTFSYNLIDKWYSSVVEDADNRLEIGSLVQLWRFRKNITDLCFALVKIE